MFLLDCNQLSSVSRFRCFRRFSASRPLFSVAGSPFRRFSRRGAPKITLSRLEGRAKMHIYIYIYTYIIKYHTILYDVESYYIVLYSVLVNSKLNNVIYHIHPEEVLFFGEPWASGDFGPRATLPGKDSCAGCTFILTTYVSNIH